MATTQQTNHSGAFLGSAKPQLKELIGNQPGQNLNIKMHFERKSNARARINRTQSMICLEPAELLALLRAAKAKGPRTWAMCVVAYKHGMRASEICNLRVDDIDLRNGNLVGKRLKGSLRTPKAVTEHRGEPLLN